MRVAALYDIHGNLPALDAVLEEVRRAGVDRIVVGGDVVPGPMARESLARLLELELPVDFIHGNCELAVLAQLEVADPSAVTYWGTASGKPLPEPYASRMRWSAEQVRAYQSRLASWPRTLRVATEGLGEVVFCHSTPRSATEIFTRLTDGRRLLPLFEKLSATAVVCGHTHMQFDRMVGETRIVNAGSVGMPLGSTGAFWALIGPDIELRRTMYDVLGAAQRIRATEYPAADENASELLAPPSEEEMLALYGKAELE